MDDASGSGLSASGRLNVTMVSTESKEDKLRELLEDRVGQLDTLVRLLKRSGALAVGRVDMEGAGEGGKASKASSKHVLALAI